MKTAKKAVLCVLFGFGILSVHGTPLKDNYSDL